MNLNSIRVRYTAAFSIIALFFIVLVLMNFNLINKTQHGMNLFGKTFNPGISAILNADRDLYQARVAELQAISNESNSEQVNHYIVEFKDNVQQGKIEQAKQLSNGDSNKLFEALRGFYNLAGELADKKSAAVHEETLTSVNRGQFILTIVSIIPISLTM
ncbi:hypothetical protein [Thalassotalea piscium]|uniref:Chemotaxis methyl-accepting receptor HlyB-like 4HB MCP domain-containing protein n=1 Tax=Thalassotalea piscium TaxID=1230533 RepID=A0A7X0NHF3_9GAMM|nr:hypothetical protein [Thalassotalea piscium]MBB6543498.1 hypothetical protein [Thalassotalea piscium]